MQSISDEFSAKDEAITPQNDGIYAKVEGLDAEEEAELALLEMRKLKKKGKHALKRDRDRYDFLKSRETLA